MYLANFVKLNKLVFRFFYENLTVFEASAGVDESWVFKNENISLYFMKVHIYIGLRVTGFTGYRFSGFFLFRVFSREFRKCRIIRECRIVSFR